MTMTRFRYLLLPLGLAASAVLCADRADGQVYARVVAHSPAQQDTLPEVDPLTGSTCGPRACPANATTYGYYRESWRRWPLEPAGAAGQLAPFAKPPRDLPATELPPAEDETSSTFRKRTPVRVDPREVLGEPPGSPVVIPDTNGGDTNGGDTSTIAPGISPPSDDALPDLFPEPNNDQLSLPEQPSATPGGTQGGQSTDDLFPAPSDNEPLFPAPGEPSPLPAVPGGENEPGDGFDLDILNQSGRRAPPSTTRLTRNPLRQVSPSLAHGRRTTSLSRTTGRPALSSPRDRSHVVPATYQQAPPSAHGRSASPKVPVRQATSRRARNPLRRSASADR